LLESSPEFIELKFSAAKPIPLMGVIDPVLLDGYVDIVDLDELLLACLSPLFLLIYSYKLFLDDESIYIFSPF